LHREDLLRMAMPQGHFSWLHAGTISSFLVCHQEESGGALAEQNIEKITVELLSVVGHLLSTKQANWMNRSRETAAGFESAK